MPGKHYVFVYRLIKLGTLLSDKKQPDSGEASTLTAFFHIEERLIEGLRQLAKLMERHEPDCPWTHFFIERRDDFSQADSMRAKRNAVQTLRAAFQDTGYGESAPFSDAGAAEERRKRLSHMIYILAGQYVTQLPIAAAHERSNKARR